LGSPIPTPTDFFLDCCVSCSARDAVSELPRGVREQEGVRFGEAGILPLQLASHARGSGAEAAAHAMCLLRCLTRHPAWYAVPLSVSAAQLLNYYYAS